ncbi:MAG: capsular polysaccharide biosynthesis protein, partial [Paracoccaceae bacterium]|nr:capsular polysaccharide biosynthesis protein [Paracoccaceae bacterium]
MATINPTIKAAGPVPRRLFFYNTGFLRQQRLRRILALAGHELRPALPGLGPSPDDGVVVWGRSPHAARGETVARARSLPLIRIEDAFLRSIRPGRMGDAPIGLMIDPCGVHFDASVPSGLERLLATDLLDNSNLLARAKDGIGRLKALDLSKYNIHDQSLAPPSPGYVLVVDQLRGDASVRHSGVPATMFREMLVFAQEENPGARVIIKTHPETAQGLRPGHYGAEHATGNVTLLDAPISPHVLLEGAVAVYTVSSQLGFEAILAGHRPRVFGQPFYAGWGLSQDETPVLRRHRMLTRAQLFAAAMLLAPTWYDPCRDRLCSFEDAVDQLEAEARAFREDRHGHIALGMRLWKRGRLQAVFGRVTPLRFAPDPKRAQIQAEASGRGILVWAGKDPWGLAAPKGVRRVEDGFLRSRGLGADLTAPLSLVADDLGIYYDPDQPSRLEHLIRAPLPPGGTQRATRLIERLTDAGLTKYNIGRAAPPDLPEGRRILVPGQVEDDASIRFGAGTVRSNLGLLQATRAANPGAVLIYKP